MNIKNRCDGFDVDIILDDGSISIMHIADKDLSIEEIELRAISFKEKIESMNIEPEPIQIEAEDGTII